GHAGTGIHLVPACPFSDSPDAQDVHGHYLTPSEAIATPAEQPSVTLLSATQLLKFSLDFPSAGVSSTSVRTGPDGTARRWTPGPLPLRSQANPSRPRKDGTDAGAVLPAGTPSTCDRPARTSAPSSMLPGYRSQTRSS